MTPASIIARHARCPECSALGVRFGDRVRTEFFGGYVVCQSCGASLLISHRSWWFAAMILGVEGFLGGAFIALLAIYYLQWWSAPLLIGAFLALGTVVAVFSPLESAGTAQHS